MHIHNVYIWLKKDLGERDLAAFEEAVKRLAQDPLIKHSYFGKPADTHNDDVENSYTYGLVFQFANLADHERYQVGRRHRQFLEEQESKWEHIVVYDIETAA